MRDSTRASVTASTATGGVTKNSRTAVPPTRRHDADFEPFAVTANDIESLNDHQFRRFMRELLRNEVFACNDAPAQFIDNPGDGGDRGQDAETVRDAAASPTDVFIPSGTTVWQYKAERRAPTEAEFSTEIAKERPKAVLEAGESYRFVAQQPRTNESVKHKLLQRVATAIGYRPEQVAFHAQSTLAERARLYPSLALLPFFHRPLEQVQAFERWAARHAAPKFDEPSRATQLTQLTEYIRTSARPSHVRVVGPAGVGKTRLVLHALERLDLARPSRSVAHGSCGIHVIEPATA